MKHDPDAGPWDMRLLRIGRHFRLDDGTKVVVGRDEKDNGRIVDAARPEDALLTTVSVPGPTSLVVGGAVGETLEKAAQLTAAHGDASAGMVEISVKRGGEEHMIQAAANDRKEWTKYRI